ncbi:protein SPIRAL1-like 5 [Herrania umbratica]|uniref:Protein SPIRAL1-like 5 n=1 Tax=Herrania umbratica TaxID=108875 RepID=A0A6J1AYC4_9ROSI|nr:protein SPIRAL1-like 5 [Herrania umbratica]
MSRGGSYGGGQSSLGYLFGADEQPSAPAVTPPIQPPYGIDTTPENPPAPNKLRSEKRTEKNVNNNYHRAQGQNSGNFITDRPSTKVKSVPGGDSSLGYLFGDK